MARMDANSPQELRHGIRHNATQFALLVLINGFVGATLGIERTIVPLIAKEELHVEGAASLLSFIAAFGLSKASANFIAGILQQRVGRKRTLILGWLLALPVPFALMYGSWSFIVLANIFLGFSQGLTWSSTVVMKVDIAGKKQRGLAVGLNESMGYLSLGLAAWFTTYLAGIYGLRPVPFYPGVLFTFAGLSLSLMVRETIHYASLEHQKSNNHTEVVGAKKNTRLWPIAQAGLINNLNDVLMWGLLPVLLAARGISLRSIALISALYPTAWALLQFGSGALSDRMGTKKLIVAGMIVQGIALALAANAYGVQSFVLISILLGVGTAMSYPTLLAAVSHDAPVSKRTQTMGLYRFWRDMGFVFGAAIISFGISLGSTELFFLVGLLTVFSGIIYAWLKHE